MAKETFTVIAMLETSNWNPELLAKHGFEAAFGIHFIRNGERTHICSLTPSSRADFIENAFVYDSENDDAHEAAGELAYEGAEESCSYFGYIDPDRMNPRFVGEVFTFDEQEIEGDLDADGRETDQYLDRIWETARENFCGGNGYEEPGILWSEQYHAWEAEQTAKHHAENRKPLQTPMLELFVAAAERGGFYSYEGARAVGWL